MRLKGITVMALVGTMAVAGMDCGEQKVLVKGGLPGLVFNVAKTGRTALGANRPKTTTTVGIFAKGPLWDTATASIDSASGQVPIALNKKVIKTIVGLVTPTISSNYLTSSISLTPPEVP